MLKPTTIDFETFGIEGRPDYPPIPVGVSIKYHGKKARYYAFGHPEENNCCWSEAKKALKEAYKTPDGILFQHAKFDLDVAEVWFGLSLPEWQKIHDTMFLLFLDDPHETKLGLKESAERILGWAAEEQDAMGEWLLKNQPVPFLRITKGKQGKNYFGKYLCFCPGKLTGQYANGDTERTEAIFNKLYPSIVEREMLEPYNTERELMPILLEMERQGVPVDLVRLSKEVREYKKWFAKIDNWICNRLGCDETLNINSGAELFNAMLMAGAINEEKALKTPKSTPDNIRYQTNKEALLLAVTDNQLLGVLKYRAQLKTCLNTFMIPWLKTAKKSKGLIFTNWNQVKAPRGNANAGAVTGRLSSNPNFQNIPNSFKSIFKHEEDTPEKQEDLPNCPWTNLPPLPKIRSYVLPFKNEILIDRDYSQQEPRILGHFDGGKILKKYNEDKWTNFHNLAHSELTTMGLTYSHKAVKITNLGIIYGMGIKTLALKTGLITDEAKNLKQAILKLYPGLEEMAQDMKFRAKNNIPIRTSGGREIYCEPPKIVDGEMREFSYKMVNKLIQGSAADETKKALIRTHRAFKKESKGAWKIILNVHDQLTSSVPIKDKDKAMEIKRQCMETTKLDVPLLSEGDTSITNWAELQPYDRKGERHE